MKKLNRILFLLMCLAVSSTVWAESINESQARSIASQFMASHAMPTDGMTLARKAPRLSTTTNQQAAYYVFNNARSGYVIVAGDDRAPAVLGYSDKGAFDSQNMPEALQGLLEGYAAQIEALNQGHKVAPPLMLGRAIRPLVRAIWSQKSPYNTLLPYVSAGNHAVVGCVATAMAQVMYYWQWPAFTSQAIPAYTSSTLSIYMPELPVTEFDWSAMQNTYDTTDTTSVAALAAAKLSLYCAQSVEMDFKTSSSGATTTSTPRALSTYFGYSAASHSVSRYNYSTQEWAEIIYSELTAGRPVIYSGSKKTGGHAFICDGYDGNGLFHFNWGWNGQSNGYFLLNVLNPDEQGTGSASGTYGYILSQAAILGVQPDDGGENEFALTSSNVTLDSYTTTRSYNSDPFTVTVSGRFHNYTSQIIAVRFGWGLYQGNTMISKLFSSYNTSLRPGYYLSSNSKELEFGSNLTSGTYRILPIYSEYGEDNWRPCVGADKNYIEVTINGNHCSYTGHGTAGDKNYTINGISMTGNMHNGRPVNINVNMTNHGESSNNFLYMFADGTFAAAALVSLETGETGDILFKYMPETAGSYTLTWSWDEDGSTPIATRSITITAMPAANLSATAHVLNASGDIINSDKFSVEFTITNNGTTTYDEDISAKLFKRTKGTSGTSVQGQNQHLTLAPGESKTLRFDLDNVIDGWQYFAYVYYYTEGNQTRMKGTSSYTIVFPEEAEVIMGDVNGDTHVNITDVTALIDYLLSGDASAINLDAADCNQDSAVNISDVTTLIDMLLRGGV